MILTMSESVSIRAIGAFLTGPVAILLLGIASLYLIIGGHILDPTNIEWIPGGDSATHFLGWDFFRHSPWEFPLGANPRYGLEISSAILYSDSIPILAFLFKPFNSILPETFQYTGIWMLLCVILQGWLGWKLIGLTTQKPLIRILGAGLFVFTPSFIHRLSGHFALAGHWIVLAALYLTITPSKDALRHPAKWVALCAIAALVHTYLLLMVLALWFSDALNRLYFSRHRLSVFAVETLLVASVSILCLWQAGLFLVSTDSFSDGGYGYYRMNLLSLFDPSGWSYILSDIPQGQFDYEGFNYLGLGSMLALLMTLPAVLINAKILLPPKQLVIFFIMLFLLFIFAITNRIGIGSYEFVIPIPPELVNAGSMFRSSGRFFWPVYYAMLIGIIALLIKGYGSKATAALLVLFFTVQIVDTSAGWYQYKRILADNSEQWKPPFLSEFWNKVPDRYDKIRIVEPGNMLSHWFKFAYYSSINVMGTDSIYLARIDSDKLKAARKRAITAIATGEYESDSLYVIGREHLALAVSKLHGENDVVGEIGDVRVVAPGWNECEECPSIAPLFSGLQINQPIAFNDKGTGQDYLLSGWSQPETWGVWSDGPVSKLSLPISAGKGMALQLDVEAHAFLPETRHHQTVKVQINGNFVGIMEFSMNKNRNLRSLPIPADALSGKDEERFIISFEIASPMCPSDLGISEDKRNLGIGLINLTVRESN